MKILGIEIGTVRPEPVIRSLDQPISPPVEIKVPSEDPRIGVYRLQVESLEKILFQQLTQSQRWEHHLTESQNEKYTFANKLEVALADIEGYKRRVAFLEARVLELETPAHGVT